MSLVRIVFVGVPALLRAIVREVVGSRPWAEVVGELDRGVPLVEAVSSTGANVAIVDDALGVDSQATALLRSSRPVCVLAIGDDGRETTLYELHPTKKLLGEVSVELLVEAARDAVSMPVEA
jgi:hypothetical protein